MPRLARVALPLKIPRDLTYLVPDELAHRVIPGQRVRVPLKKKIVSGHVVSLEGGDYAGSLKTIVDVADDAPTLRPDVMRLCAWISEYYAAPIGEVLNLAAVPAAGGGVRYRLDPDAARPTAGLAGEICCLLARRWMSALAISRRFQADRVIATLLDLVDQKVVVRREARGVSRRGAVTADAVTAAAAAAAAARPAPVLPPLAAEQASASSAIISSMGRFAPILLHGVTASGKTRVYLEAIIEARRRGLTSLYLLPEIAMCLLLEDELAGLLPFCTIHSMLSPAEKAHRFAAIQAGEYSLVIGTRSALFSPLPDLGLIIVDEEHDASYKQDERVRYNARDAAVMRAKFGGIPVVMGSATPSIETYQLGLDGRYETLSLPSRFAGRPLPASRVVDMRGKKRGFMSVELREAMLERLRAGEQVILLLNRRGYAPSLICNACGGVFRCPDCQVSMVYHRDPDCFLCHYCGLSRAQPQQCSECGESRFALTGEGTEKVMEVLQTEIAGYRVDRLDSDVSTSPARVRQILQEFGSGAIQVLVGTQMLAKGHHFPMVTLVGVITMDHLLGLPDFRAAERVFQLVAQVAGRSGRGELPGEVIIQTRYPQHYALRAGCSQDYGQFFDQEIRYRRTLGYPPFSSLALITFRDAERTRAARHARAFGGLMERLRAPAACVIGPVFAPIPRIKAKWRVQILLKGPKKAVRETLRKTLLYAERNKMKFGDHAVDVDPVDLM